MRKKLSLFLSILLASIHGCTVGPDYKRPDTGIMFPAHYQGIPPGEQALDAPGFIAGKWWEDFGDEVLNRLVEKVLSRNWDIRKAAARIVEFESQFTETRSKQLPVVDLNASAKRSYLQEPVPGGNNSYQRKMRDQFSLSLAAAYEIDLWGRLSRMTEAARADLLQAEETRLALINSIVAEAVSTYLEMEALERRIQLTRSTIENYQRALLLVEGRYRRGLSDGLAVRQARRSLAEAEANMPTLFQELGEAQHRLSKYVGRYPKTAPPRPQPETYFQRLAAVPHGLPSDLLRRRPDICAAEAALRAANARIGAARANRFPSISLTGSLGYISPELNDLILERNRILTGGVDLLAPLFDAGRRKAMEDRAAAQYQQVVATYADTILTAFGEVEGALLRRERLLEKRERLLKLVNESRLTLHASGVRYSRGVGNYLDVLEAQRTRYVAEDRLVLTDREILTNRVGLYRALGGGWKTADALAPEAISESKEK